MRRAMQKRLGPCAGGAFVPLRQGYGMTEMSPASNVAKFGTDKPSSIGQVTLLHLREAWPTSVTLLPRGVQCIMRLAADCMC